MDDNLNDESMLLDYLEESFMHINEFENQLIDFDKESQKLLLIQSLFRNMHTLKANTGCFDFPKLEQTLHKSENIFNLLQKKEEEELNSYIESNEIVDLFFELSDFIKEALVHIENHKSDIDEENIELTKRIDQETDKLQSTNPKTPEKAPAKEKKGLKKIQAKALEMLKQRRKEASNSPNESEQEIPKLDDNIVIKLDSLNSLTALSSELMLVRNQLGLLINEYSDSNNDLYNKYHRIDFLIQNLSEKVTKIRMQPLSIITDKLKRSIRSLAKDFNKEVNFITEGDSIEIDRNILDSLKDSLVHIFRNAIDHGLETAEERIAVNKDPTGTIRVKAQYGENNIILTISDDGRGIDTEKIKEKAIQNNLASKDDLKKFSRNELYDFIFHPNFSTKDEISKISGRGVGMNVVKESLQNNNGSIEIKSQKGKGTTFTIKLPLTLAIGSAVIVDLDQVKYAIPSNIIREMFSLKKELLFQQPEIEIRDEHYKVIFARDILNKDTVNLEEYYKTYEDLACILIDTDNAKFVFVVDDILDLQNIVIKTVPEGLKNLDYCSGTTILPQGNVALIFDMENIYKSFISEVQTTEQCPINPMENIEDSINNKLISFRIGEYLFGVNRDLVKETVYKKAVTPIPTSSTEGLMNLRDNVILNKKLAPILEIDTQEKRFNINIVLEVAKQIFAIEVDDIEDSVELREDQELIKEPDPRIKNCIKQGYLLDNGSHIYVLKEDFCLKAN